MSLPFEKYDFKNKTKWAVVDKAFLTGSGLNEIHVATATKAQAVIAAKALGLKIGPRDQYGIIKMRWKEGYAP